MNLIQLKLESIGLYGLYETLEKLAGLRIGNKYILLELYAVGGQSVLWITAEYENLNHFMLTRHPLLPYHRPAYLQASSIYEQRKQIEFESQVLERVQSKILPLPYGLYYDKNPLYPKERDSDIIDRETYLVMEHIKGITGNEKIHLLHSSETSRAQIMQFLFLVAGTAIDLFLDLHNHGYLYTDFNPRNLISEALDLRQRIRIVDAGSIIPNTPVETKSIPFSWAYIPAEYYEKYKTTGFSDPLWPTEKFVMCTLGKTLWQILSNKQPIPGEDLRLNLKLDLYPSSMVSFVRDLINGNIRDFTEAKLVHDKLILELGLSDF